MELAGVKLLLLAGVKLSLLVVELAGVKFSMLLLVLCIGGTAGNVGGTIPKSTGQRLRCGLQATSSVSVKALTAANLSNSSNLRGLESGLPDHLHTNTKLSGFNSPLGSSRSKRRSSSLSGVGKGDGP